MVRDKPISFEEKTYNKFKAEKGFFERVKTIEDYVAGRPRRAGLGLVHRDVRLLHRLPQGLHGRLGDGDRAAGCCCRRSSPCTPSSRSACRRASRSCSERSRSSRRPSPAIEDPELRRDFLVAVKKNIDGLAVDIHAAVRPVPQPVHRGRAGGDSPLGRPGRHAHRRGLPLPRAAGRVRLDREEPPRRALAGEDEHLPGEDLHRPHPPPGHHLPRHRQQAERQRQPEDEPPDPGVPLRRRASSWSSSWPRTRIPSRACTRWWTT